MGNGRLFRRRAAFFAALLLVPLLYVYSVLPQRSESLDAASADLTERHAAQIALRMGNLVTKYRKGMEGVLLVVRAERNLHFVRYHAIDANALLKMFLWRTSYTKRLFDAIAATAPVGTIVHYAWGDADVFYSERIQGPHCPFARGIRDLTNDFPELFWVHQNPTIVNPATGEIGPRTVPVPHEAAHWNCRDRAALSATRNDLRTSFRSRVAGVVWRGVSTGSFPVYNRSDRFRTVHAFNGVQNCSVKFASSAYRLERDMLGAPMSHNEMLRYRVNLDIDGNANAWEGLRWKLASGTAVVKISALRFVQWYYRYMRDGLHLLQLSPDDKSLVDKALALAHNVSRAQQMAENALSFTAQYLSCEGLEQAYDEILKDWDFYRAPHDWRIQGSIELAEKYHPVSIPLWHCGGDG